jgi:hypothetical protein
MWHCDYFYYFKCCQSVHTAYIYGFMDNTPCEGPHSYTAVYTSCDGPSLLVTGNWHYVWILHMVNPRAWWQELDNKHCIWWIAALSVCLNNKNTVKPALYLNSDLTQWTTCFNPPNIIIMVNSPYSMTPWWLRQTTHLLSSHHVDSTCYWATLMMITALILLFY